MVVVVGLAGVPVGAGVTVGAGVLVGVADTPLSRPAPVALPVGVVGIWGRGYFQCSCTLQLQLHLHLSSWTKYALAHLF